MSMIDRDVAFLLGLPFNVITMDETIDDAIAHIGRRKPGYYITANADFIAQAHNNEALKDILFHADRVVCDGMPLVWLSKYFKPELPERVAGSDMVFRLFEEAQKREWKVFFLGTDDATLEMTKGILEQNYQGIQIVGTYAPPYGTVESWPNDDILKRIKQTTPDLLLVAVGCPKQEYWISRFYRESGVPLSIGIGASLDFICGSQTRAPAWIQKIGMEWMWRMLSDPKRLAKRYAKDLYYLILLALRQRSLLVKGAQLPMSGHTKDDENKPTPAFTYEESYHLLKWSGSIEYGTIGSCAIPAAYDKLILLDLSGVESIDSSGIGLIAKLAREARQAEVPFALVQASDVVRQVIDAMHLSAQFPTFDTESEALLHFIKSGYQASVFSERTIKLPPPFGRKENAECLDVLNQAVAGAKPNERLLIDISELELVDSFAISKFLSAYREMRDKKGQLRLVRLQAQSEQTLRMTGVYGILVSGRSDV